MIKLFITLFLFSITLVNTSANEVKSNQKQITTVNLKHISGEDVVSVLRSLIDKSISINEGYQTMLE